MAEDLHTSCTTELVSFYATAVMILKAESLCPCVQYIHSDHRTLATRATSRLSELLATYHHLCKRSFFSCNLLSWDSSVVIRHTVRRP